MVLKCVRERLGADLQSRNWTQYPLGSGVFRPRNPVNLEGGWRNFALGATVR